MCRCAVTHTASKNSPRCLKLATQFEDECEEDVQCQYLRDSVCKNNSCVCKNGYYLHNHVMCDFLFNIESILSSILILEMLD